MKENKRKVKVIERDMYTVFFENVYGLTFAHIDMHKWSHKALKFCRKDLDLLILIRQSPIFVYVSSDDVGKLRKFCNLLGFSQCFPHSIEDPRANIMIKKG